MVYRNVFCSLILIIFTGFISKSFSQQIQFIDVIRADVNLAVIPDQKQVRGDVAYYFDILENTDSIVLDARSMEIASVKLSGKAVDYIYTDQSDIKIYKNFKQGNTYSIQIIFEAQPQNAMYFISAPNKQVKEVWTQGQGKYTSNWLPSFDDMNEKIEFDLSIRSPSKFTVLANGKLKQKLKAGQDIIWQYDMVKPMSSYLVALAIGEFKYVQSQSKSGVIIKNYYSPGQESKVEPTYRYTKELMDFYESEIGVNYPWQEYKQVGVQDFLYAGMENTSLTIFSDSYMVDSIAQIDHSYFEVNAHELAHQWFGNLVTETHATHHWLQEGFATYYALLAAKHIFGEDYFYSELYAAAMDLKELNARSPESLLNPQANSLTFYQRGAWALVALRDKIGDRNFKKAIKKYLKDHAYKNVDTHDFFNVVMAKSQLDLEDFIDQWLVQKEFPFDKAKKILNKNELSSKLLALDAMGGEQLEDFISQNTEIYLDSSQSALVDKIIQRAANLPLEQRIDVYRRALQSPVLKNRQSVAQHIAEIPTTLRAEFEKLLSDQSYKTIELALLKLCMNFPELRREYLDRSEGIDGFKGKNIKTAWLAMALITPEYRENQKLNYYNTLIHFTESYQPYELRQNAFSYLANLQAFNEPALKNLIQACLHPVWQFSKFSRHVLDNLLKQPAYSGIIKEIKKDLNKQEQRFLNDRLDQ